MTSKVRKTDSYMELVDKFRLRAIRSEKELEMATEIIHSLLGKPLDDGAREYLDALADLVWLYEERNHPFEDLEPAQMLAGLIENRQVSQRTVAAGTGVPVSTISELISRKRGFTLLHVEKFSRYFQVSPEVFIRAHESKTTRRPNSR